MIPGELRPWRPCLPLAWGALICFGRGRRRFVSCVPLDQLAAMGGVQLAAFGPEQFDVRLVLEEVKAKKLVMLELRNLLERGIRFQVELGRQVR